MVTNAKNSNHTWIPATLNGGVSMDGINLDESDVRDPYLMTAIAAGNGSAGNTPISRHHTKIQSPFSVLFDKHPQSFISQPSV